MDFPNNRNIDLCIVDVNNGISRAFTQTIPNNEANTIVPIICRQVITGTIILSMEHESYMK
ncbi:hypothetical protein H311_00083 [Anncaliia algerae PRA109]|nr:hypothetical protein H311_00083 [Anncaliia algerae PRA109]